MNVGEVSAVCWVLFILTAHPSEESTGAEEKHPKELLRTPGRNQEIKMNMLLQSFTFLEALVSFSVLARALHRLSWVSSR